MKQPPRKSNVAGASPRTKPSNGATPANVNEHGPARRPAPMKPAPGQSLGHLTKEALRASEHRYRLLAEAAQDFIFIIDGQDRVQYVNAFGAAQVGGVPEDFIGQDRSRLFPPGVASRQKHNLLKVLEQGQPIYVEGATQFPHGEIWLGTRLVPVRDDTGRVTSVLGLSRDITTRKHAEAALRASEARFATVFRMSPVAIGISRIADGRFTDVNRAFSEVYGYAREEVVGHTSAELKLWVDPTQRNRVVQTLLQLGHVSNLEVRFRHKSGTVGNLLMSCERIEIEGEPCLLGMAQNITERNRAEEVLRQTQAKYRQLLETMTDGFATADMSGRFQEFNRAYCALVGYTKDELHHLTYRDLTPARWHDSETQIIREQVLTRGYSDVYEKEYRKKDGTVFPVELRTILIRDEANQPVGMWAIVRDITERKGASEALRQSQLKYRRLLETMTDAYVTVDLSGRIQEFNRAYCALLGYNEDELRQLSYVDITPARWHGFEAQIVRHQILSRGYSDVYEKEYRKKDGTTVPVELRSYVVRDDAQKPLWMWAIVRDITERKKAEEAVRQLSHRLWRAQEDERRRIARELHDSTVQRLAAVLMNLTLLQECPQSPAFPRLLKEARAQVDECVQEIRTFTYLLHPPDLEQLGLKPALRSYIAGFSKRSGIRVALQAPEDPGRFSDEIELALFRVVQEGLGNILRHAKTQVARVRLTWDTARITLEVSDPGRGIPTKTLRALRAGGPLSGVGLAGMKERLSQVRGQLELDSNRRGTTLRAVIPLTAPGP